MICFVCEQRILVVGGTASQPRRVCIDDTWELVHDDCYESIEAEMLDAGNYYDSFSLHSLERKNNS
jgi:hypothetical protein